MNRTPCLAVLAAAILMPLLAPAAGLERLYWDTSDEVGLQGGSGTWSAEAKNWNTSADGTGQRVAWKAGAVAVFGSEQLVLVEGSPEVSGIEAAAVDLAGGTISFPAGGLEVATEGEVVLSSAVRGQGPVVKRGTGMLSLCGINSLPGGLTLASGKLRFYSIESLGQAALRVEGTAVLIPGAANMNMGNPVSIKPEARLVIDTEVPEFTLSGPVTGGGTLEKTGHVKLTIAGAFDSAVRLNGALGIIEFRPAQPVKLEAAIKGGLLRAAAGSLAEGSKLLISNAGALAASGAREGLQAWVESGWIAPESNGTLAWDGVQEIGGTTDLKPFFGKYPSMSLGSCGKVVVTGHLELPGSVLRIGGGGGDVEIRTPLTGPLQLIIGAPSTLGNVTLSAENTFTGGLRIDGGTLRVGNARAIPAGEITMGNRFTSFDDCQLNLNNFDLPNPVKLQGAATIKNAGGKASTLSGAICAGEFSPRLAAERGSSLKVTGNLSTTGFLVVGTGKFFRDGKANLVELAPTLPNTAKRVQIERGIVLRAVDGMGLPSKARLVLNGGVFESHGEFQRPLLRNKGVIDGEGGVSFLWATAGSGFSAHGGPLTVRLTGASPWMWGTQADGSTKPGNHLLVLNAPTADSTLTLDVPLDLAGEEVDRKNIPTPLHSISVQAACAMLAQPVTNSGANPAGILKLGDGTLVFQAANSYTGDTLVRGGGVAFGSPAAMAGTGRTIKPENGTVVAANFPIDNAFLQRLASPSGMNFTVALGADSSAPLDFNSPAGAILRGASLGSTLASGTATYSGTLTPCDKILRLGGGGGTLVVTSPANVPSVIGGSLTSGRVILPEGTTLPKDFALLDGSLLIGSQDTVGPSRRDGRDSPTDGSASRPYPNPTAVTASANDRWVDAIWSFPINPEGGFAVEWSKDGKTFESAGNAWPEERRFPIFLKNPPKTWLRAPGEVFVRVAAIDGEGKTGAWSEVAKTTCAERFDPEKEIPARFAGSADQRKYNVNDPERLVTYTEQEKQAQWARGREIADQLKALWNTTGREFIIPPGIYRVKTGQLAVQGAKNLTIRANGVEIIVDEDKSGPVFSFTGCKDILLTGRAAANPPARKPGVFENLKALFGSKPPQAVAEANPLVIDSEQLAFTLARIVGFNSTAGTLDVEILPGYRTQFPQLERMLAFRPDGSFANTQSLGWRKAVPLVGRMFRLTSVGAEITQNQNASIKPGNLLVIHVPDKHHNPTATRDCGNMTYESIRFVNGCGAPADARTAGHTIYRDWRNSPRAGTNRLELACGLGQFGKDGGTFLFENCEFGTHLDDGINLGAGFGMTIRQTGDKSLVIAGPEPTPGQTLTFYDFYSWGKTGEAKIVSATPLKELETFDAADSWCQRNEITSIALHNLWKVTLETPVRPTPFAAVSPSNHRCDNITVRGCLFRDQLAQIMLLQGATSGIIENNLLLRSTATAISMQFSQYWWEGPQPSNFIIRNNTIRDNPIWISDGSEGGAGSISVFPCTVRGGNSSRVPLSETEPVTSRLFSGFRIEGNTIINPGGYGIMLRNTKKAVVSHNKIINPGSVRTPFPVTCIGLNEVSDTVVSDNELVFRKGIAEKAISILEGCDMKSIRIENNQESQN